MRLSWPACWALLALACSEKAPEPSARTLETGATIGPASPAVVSSSAAAPAALRPARAPVAVERTPRELDEALRSSCSKAVAEKRPLLLDFGADWCGDCRKLHGMKAEAPLAPELENWELVDINITDPDKHAELMAAYQIKAIARWIVLRPQSCSAPVTEWPRGPSRVVEPASSGDATAQELVAWLRSARG